MKSLRAITFLFIAILVISSWPPSLAHARQSENQSTVAPNSPNLGENVVAPKVVPLTINNKSGGIVFVTLVGPKTYYFVVAEGKGKFLIVPGRYKVTAISTACSGAHEQKKNFRNGGSLVYYCDSQ